MSIIGRINGAVATEGCKLVHSQQHQQSTESEKNQNFMIYNFDATQAPCPDKTVPDKRVPDQTDPVQN